ncbi:MAG: transglycosylase SLT domain-containing protein [Alphaproteobacteria bacterium]|nr:transglycosylase SLT domain-containing protein [Alphaproteobacteria bacterium]
MQAKLLVLAAPLVLAACASTAPPSQTQNACAIFEEQGSWWRAAKRAERRWGAPPALQLAIIHQESGFDHDARPARRGGFLFIPGRRPSSAYGYAQATNETWARYERARGDSGVDRDEFADATDFVAWYVRTSHDELGLGYDNARAHYLAYHEGQGGYRRGTYRSKGWLMDVAGRVQANADRYARQLDECDGRLDRGWLPF